MDPTDPGGTPPPPERPTPPRPTWPPPPPAASWQGQPPGSAPPVPPGSAPSGPPAWGQPPVPRPAQWPAWGTPIPPPPPPPGRRAGWIIAGVAGLLVLALVAAVLVVRSGEQRAPARQAVGRRPSTTIAPDPATDLPKLLAKRAKAVRDGNRAAFLATVDKRQRTYYRGQAVLFARMRTAPFSAYGYRLEPNDLRSAARLKRRYRAEQV